MQIHRGVKICKVLKSGFSLFSSWEGGGIFVLAPTVISNINEILGKDLNTQIIIF